MALDYIKTVRGLDFVELGMKVQFTYNGKFGVIKGENSSGNLNILFDGDKKVSDCHPTWAMKYFDKEGNLIAEFPA